MFIQEKKKLEIAIIRRIAYAVKKKTDFELNGEPAKVQRSTDYKFKSLLCAIAYRGQ